MSTKQDNKNKINFLENISNKYLVLIPIVSGLLLRLYQLTQSSIWHDEGYTMWLLRYNFAEIIERTARDVHPPAYYLLAKPWVILFGSSAFSIRFLSLLFSLGIIYFAYKTIEIVFNKNAAFWTAMLVAFSPFMVRFGQEARMYGVVAFFTTLATYFLVKYIKDKKSVYLPFYVFSMIIAMYTQYYSFFVIISHWIILAIYTSGFFTLRWKDSFYDKFGVFNYKWWLANITLLALYLPWFPVAYRQVTRVSGSYWIKPEWITIKTIPDNIYQFVTYTHFGFFANGNIFLKVIYWLLILILVASGIFLVRKNNYKKFISLFVFGYLPMILVFILSKLRTPVYQDRYFPFSAVALFAIWGVSITFIKNKYSRLTVGILAILVLLAGNYIMHKDVNHNMKQLKNTVSENYKNGDIIYSGELYTFLDGAYYFGYDNIKLLSKPVDGYGETSLFYDKQDQYIIDPDDVNKYGSRIWVIGKTGEKDYFGDKLWSNWDEKVYFEEFKNNGLKAVLYTRK